MKEPIQIKISQHHFKESPGYIFDDCPLMLAFKEQFPDTFFAIFGALKVTIIWKEKDEMCEVYQISSNYTPTDVDGLIAIAKSGGQWRVEFMIVILTYLASQENLFLNPINEDHVSQKEEANQESSEKITFSENPFEN